MKIKKKDLLIEKESGSYGCPNYINPKYGKKILDAYGISSTDKAALLFTEVMENFGIQLIQGYEENLTKEAVINLTTQIEIE